MTIDIRWQQRFQNFRKALTRLNDVVALAKKRSLTEIEEEGLIQRFEYTHELAWKTLKDFLQDQDGGLQIGGSKDATKLAFQRGLITQGDVWLEMIDSRNLSTHTYDETTAEKVKLRVIENYVHHFNALQDRLTQWLTG